MSDTVDQWRGAVHGWAKSNLLIKRVWFFGSRIRGNHKPDSDLDVAVELDLDVALDDCKGLTYWMRQADRWAQELSRLVPYRVDLQWYEAGSNIERYVASSGIEVYTKA